MAIPTWLWTGTNAPARGETSVAETDTSADETDLEAISDDFELLASPVRVEILLALAERDGAVRYSALRDAISIEDNGRLNYHLRRLEGAVDAVDGRYALTARGERLRRCVSGPGSDPGSAETHQYR